MDRPGEEPGRFGVGAGIFKKMVFTRPARLPCTMTVQGSFFAYKNLIFVL